MKLCECGCGGYAPIATITRRDLGHVKGQAIRFINGHNNRTHGHQIGYIRTKTYGSWMQMKARCFNPKQISYPRYGGRETPITVCDRWLKFENFLADMGERPEGTTIDRINVNGNYEPGNCKWSTPKEQAQNRR